MTLKIFPSGTLDIEFKQFELCCANNVVKAKTGALMLIMHVYRTTKSVSEPVRLKTKFHGVATLYSRPSLKNEWNFS